MNVQIYKSGLVILILVCNTENSTISNVFITLTKCCTQTREQMKHINEEDGVLRISILNITNLYIVVIAQYL